MSSARNSAQEYVGSDISLIVSRGPNVGLNPPRLVGLGLEITRYGPEPREPQPDVDSLPILLSTLISSLSSLPSLRAVVLHFLEPIWMKIAAEKHPTIRHPLSATRHITYRFCCIRARLAPVSNRGENGYDYILCDPASLEPTSAPI